MTTLRSDVEQSRIHLLDKIDSKRKSEYGQYMTPSNVADFMASLFTEGNKNIRILDAGAGIGSLSLSFLGLLLPKVEQINSLDLVAYEIDPLLTTYLWDNISTYKSKFANHGLDINAEVSISDFIENAVTGIQFNSIEKFTHAILNPPYKKIHSRSKHRKLLSHLGVETVNLYSAFVALAIRLLDSGGELVAIIPRSFCNGPYYKSFRTDLMAQTAIKRIHLFTSRTEAFKDDDVLQENVIVHLKKDAVQESVVISTSTDSSFNDIESKEFTFPRIVDPLDLNKFIHIPTSQSRSALEISSLATLSLKELGINVSTGPVVDFRVQNFLSDEPTNGTVPLLYPSHFVGLESEWPKDGKKPNAIHVHPETKKWLFPNGYYVVVRRFSSKEEPRRINASVVEPELFNYAQLGFENHLNVFHSNKEGLIPEIAFGLAAYLNSKPVDDYFRLFNGHTQVNATDLKSLKYPDYEELFNLGKWVKANRGKLKEQLDEKVLSLL